VPDPDPKGPRHRFGPFELDPSEGRLHRDGVPVRLQDLPCRLLTLLVERPGEVVTRDELQRQLWPADTFVEFDNCLAVAIRKVRAALGDDAEAPRYVETLPRRGYRFLPAVTVLPPRGGVASAAASAPRARFFHWAAAILVLASVVGVHGRLRTRHLRPGTGTSAAPAVRVRRSIALLGFRNLRGRPEDDWLSAAFTEMLGTELAAGGELRLVPGENVSRARSELPLADEDTLIRSTLRQLRSDPGADLVVVGSYTPLSGKQGRLLRLDLRVQDTAAGETVAEYSVTGDPVDLFPLVEEAGARLRAALGVRPLSRQGAAAVRVSLPADPMALRFYTEGRARLRTCDFPGARDSLLKAVAAEPLHPLVHAALSVALEHLGYDSRALDEARRALELATALPERERLLVEGQYREAAQDWPGAAGAYRALMERFPDDLEYGLRLASAQARIDPARARVTLAVLRRLPRPIGEDPRIDLLEASTWVRQDLAKARAAVERAIVKGRAEGAQLLVARAYGMECQQASVVGASFSDLVAACENARHSFATAGDRNNAARTLNDFAGVYYQRGDLARAQAMWSDAAREFREVGDVEGLAAVANNLGDVGLLQGNLAEAKAFLDEALPSYEALGDKDGIARVLSDLGDTLRESGDLHAARIVYQQARTTAEEIHDSSVVAIALAGLGGVALDEGDLRAARSSYEEALALRKGIGEKQAVAQTEVALGRLAIEEGRPANAEPALRRCREQFHRERQADDELAATTALVDDLRAQGRTAEAREELGHLRPRAEQTRNLADRLQALLVSARVSADTSQLDEAQRDASLVSREAREHDLTGAALEARLALAEVASRRGRIAAASQQRHSVERIARSKGFGLIAGKAHGPGGPLGSVRWGAR
jgi:DNA-binding winged helix-turn-helix (wHTH) protein/tetratricopeptide (TPR) repeat protein